MHEPDHHDPKTMAEATKPTTHLMPVAIGVVVAWIIGSRFNSSSPAMPFQDLAIAVSAIVGGIVVWLPRGTPGAGRLRGIRVLMIIAGAGIVAVVFGFLRVIIPHTSQVPGQMAAWGILLLACLVAFTAMRRYGLPLLLGGLAMAITFGVGGTDINADFGALLQNAILPALIASLLAIMIDRLLPSSRGPAETPSEDTEPEADGGPVDRSERTPSEVGA